MWSDIYGKQIPINNSLNFIYHKILISPGAYFWSKDLFAKFFLGEGGGLIHGCIFAF